MSRKEINSLIRTAYRTQRKIEAEATKVPEKGKEFSESVLLTTREIISTIEKKEFATLRQIEALQNMLGGLKQWTKQRKRSSTS